MLTVPLLLVSTILIAYTVTQAIYYDYLISELKCKIETEAQKKQVFQARRPMVLSSTNGAPTILAGYATTPSTSRTFVNLGDFMYLAMVYIQLWV